MTAATRTLTRGALAALLSFSLAAPAAADPKPKAAPEPVTVPFQLLKTGHFLVQVKLNGKGPYQLIFDTGAPTMLINNRIANDSGVIGKKTPRPVFAPFGSMGQFKIEEMELGGVKAKDVQTMVMDHPTVAAFSDFFKRQYGPIDGIVGFPFFARYKMTVDYKNQELTFVPSGYKPGDILQQMMRT
ncbi:MAG TPA: retropepsin-like aspartic protease, partial [Gemmataceae bacterium]